jgi:hypothetical protein
VEPHATAERWKELEREVHRLTRPLPLCDRHEGTEPGRLTAKSGACSC